MFIQTRYSGYVDGSQSAGGLFLILMVRKYAEHRDEMAHLTEVRAVVRYARLTQLGHFMMGTVKVGPARLTVSGAYGNDGLPMSVPPEAFDRGIPLPPALYEAWSQGGGHNSSGSEANAMRAWALENIDYLRGRKAFPPKEKKNV